MPLPKASTFVAALLVVACEKAPPQTSSVRAAPSAIATFAPPTSPASPTSLAAPSTSASSRTILEPPTAERRRALAGCDAEAAYYGIGRPVDYAAARECASVQRATDGGPPIGGAAVLLMIYANGKGVPVDLDLALQLAREADGAPAEVEGRVARLSAAKASGKLEKELDFCDDVTSGLMAGFCSARDERLRSVAREKATREATRALPKEAVDRLDRARRAFFEARSMLEVDLTGTMRGSMSIAEESHLEDVHVAMLNQLSDPGFTPPSGDAATVERALQSTYDALLRCKRKAPSTMPGEIDAAGIQKTERLWLAYREAWLGLVAADKRVAWRAWLAEKRTAMLKELADGC